MRKPPMIRSLVCLPAVFALALLGGACSSTPDPGASMDAGPPDLGPRFAIINGCTVADYARADYTKSPFTPDVNFPKSGMPMQYLPNCVKITAGGSVNWAGDF